jgi:hypothetical protein
MPTYSKATLVDDLADSDRCMGACRDGQCRNKAEHGDDYCCYHNGVSTEREEKDGLYYLTQARHRIRLAQLKDHEQVKSLREEIALARILVEDRWNQIKNESDLMAACPMLNALLLTLERLIKSSHVIEQNLGVLLAKPTVILLGQNIVNLLIQELKQIEGYEEIVDRITNKMFTAIESVVNKDGA